MRVTAATKEETRQRIISAALERFKTQGFEAATTRDIARQARVATGTLFNYFPSKDAIVVALSADSLAAAVYDFTGRKRQGASLDEDLFLYVASGLRRLKRHRAYLGAFIQANLSPLVSADSFPDVDAIRVSQLEQVQEIIASHKLSEISPVAMQLYWTLFLGILSYWTRDRSPKQEDSLALVDQSVSMFCDWLRREHNNQKQAEA
jgi:AcrR family transcriptional regulator